MATRTGRTKPGPIGTAVLAQLADLEACRLSPETARELLKLGFDQGHRRRADRLSKKAQEGSLTPAEQADLDEYIRVANLIAILQSRARQALKRAGLSS